ncbi:hypothetical protein ILUMI_26896 [Ignelater luminosus]|uniref:Protein phosphatase methylesterase 1 n=1 Tax=Ignelater luminosus TaxID=2038154 RepID=A0A8K0C3Y2_IGNLU|nr:hypothetical protein ILUMI_26896 [Ignelater luminosus]
MSSSRSYFALRRSPSKLSEGDCKPVMWSKYFKNQQEVIVDDDKFNIYSCGESGPVLLLIHGGGYSALTWSLFVEEIKNKIECRILAVDLRGHGNTTTTDEENLSLDKLTEDVANIIDVSFGNNIPSIILVGHSLGGAIAVALAKIVPNVIGLCVIDVVEGTAMEALSSMHNVLRSRPKTFRSVEHAIIWSFKCGQTRNLDAARVSVPGQIKNLLTGKLAAEECDDCVQDIKDDFSYTINCIREDCETTTQEIEDNNRYTWRIDLSKTESYWNGWFKDLSKSFLDVQVPKVLLLANIHRLDTTLTVAQMQGKFQLQVLPRSGHAIHEDQPIRVAEIISGFLLKQKLATAKKVALFNLKIMFLKIPLSVVTLNLSS